MIAVAARPALRLLLCGRELRGRVGSFAAAFTQQRHWRSQDPIAIGVAASGASSGPAPQDKAAWNLSEMCPAQQSSLICKRTFGCLSREKRIWNGFYGTMELWSFKILPGDPRDGGLPAV